MGLYRVDGVLVCMSALYRQSCLPPPHTHFSVDKGLSWVNDVNAVVRIGGMCLEVEFVRRLHLFFLEGLDGENRGDVCGRKEVLLCCRFRGL